MQPGTVFWNGGPKAWQAVFVLAPDRLLPALDPLLDLGLLALFDALAGLAPPQVPLALDRGGRLLVNGGQVATIGAEIAPAGTGQQPDWALLGFAVALDRGDAAPGATPDLTCLREEGFGQVEPDELLASLCRHLLAWLDVWTQDGPDGLALAVQASVGVPLARAAA